MKFALRSLSALFAILLTLTAITPALAHGGVETIVASGLMAAFLIAVALVIIAIIVVCVLVIVISLWRWRSRAKKGERRLPRLIIIPIFILTCFPLFCTSLVGSVWIHFIYKQVAGHSKTQEAKPPAPENIPPPQDIPR